MHADVRSAAASAEVDGGGYAKGRARRRAIIEIAAQQFAQRGFVSATILEIAAACGISRAGLLHHFPDKAALLQAVLEDRDFQDHHWFTPYIRIRGGIGILRGMVDLAEHNRQQPGLVELFARLSIEATDPDHPANGYFRERYDRVRAGTAQALRSAARAGYLRPGIDPDKASVCLTAVMDGLQVQWLLDDRIDMAQHLRPAILELLTAEGAAAFGAAVPT
jgi:AcrR family transcriptional regulator